MDEESELLKGIQAGEESSFKDLVLKYQDKVFNICLGFLRNNEDAEDVAQEVFIHTYKSIHAFKGESSLDTWIHRIAVNKSMEKLRYDKREKRFAWLTSLFGKEEHYGQKHKDDLHPGVQIENKERAKVLFGAIDKLADNQRVAFTLHKIEGCSYAEITEIMKISTSAVESLLHRARGNLRKLLKVYYESE